MLQKKIEQLEAELEEKNKRQKVEESTVSTKETAVATSPTSTNLFQFSCITSQDFQNEKQRAIDEALEAATAKAEAEKKKLREEAEVAAVTAEDEKKQALEAAEAEKQKALEAATTTAEAEKKKLEKKLKQRIHELEQQIVLQKIKPTTPPRLVKQALIASIASLCSPPKPYDA